MFSQPRIVSDDAEIIDFTDVPSDSKVEVKGIILGEERNVPVAMPTLGMMLGFAGQNRVFSIRMSKSAQHVTSGAGAMALATPVYPSSFLQFTQISVLFNQCRIRKVRMQMSSNINPNSSSGGSTLIAGATFALAFQARPGSGASPATSTTEVLRLPGVKLYNPTTIVRPIVVTYTFPRDLPWSDINATGSGSDPTGATYGYFSHCSVGSTATASTAYTTYLVEAEFQFRGLN